MTPTRTARLLWLQTGLLLTVLLASACAHYPVNAPLARYDPQSGYRGQYVGRSGGSDTLMLFVSFSGGGTRAAAFAYGGVSDNLGLRGFLERILALGGFWETLRRSGAEQVQKVVFLVVDAEVEESRKYYRSADPPPLGAMVSSYMATTEVRYDADTFLLLRERLGPWAEDVRRHRCGSGPVSTAPGACGDIRFYVITVKFNALQDAAERAYLNGLPTSFVLSDEAVDRLRDAARRILVQSDEFQRLLRDLQ